MDRSVGFPGSKSDALEGRLPADAKRWLDSSRAGALQTPPLRWLCALGLVLYLALFCVSVYHLSVDFPTPVRVAALVIILGHCFVMRLVWKTMLKAIRPVITLAGEKSDPWKIAQIANAKHRSRHAVALIIVALTAFGIAELPARLMLVAGFFCLALNAVLPHVIIALTLSVQSTDAPSNSAVRGVD
jgi:hypothetical protein